MKNTAASFETMYSIACQSVSNIRTSSSASAWALAKTESAERLEGVHLLAEIKKQVTWLNSYSYSIGAYYHDFLQYLEEKVRDHQYGSWIHQLDQRNQKLETVWPGKPDIYHALQSMLIPYLDPAVSVAVVVRNSITDISF